jgi:mannose-6-phosphate isomerase-like protein (cupin superfamily)
MMFVKRFKDCREFIAGDGSILRELLSPEKQALEIRYSLAYAKVPAGQRTRRHRLDSSEVYYIVAGEGVMHVDEEAVDVGPNCAICIPPRSVQYIENTGNCDLEFLCIVDPAWRQEDEEVLDR